MCMQVPAASKPARSIDLDPADWYRATWRNLPPLPRPRPDPFDLQDALARLAKVSTRQLGREWDWKRATIAPSLTDAEASFWLLAMISTTRALPPRDLAANWEAGGLPPRPPIDLQHIRQAIARLDYPLAPEIILPLAHLLPREDLCDLLIHETLRSAKQYYVSTTGPLLTGFRRYLLPYLTPEDTARFRARILRSGLLQPASVKPHQQPPAVWLVAACIGMHAELLALVRGWPGEATKGHYARSASYNQAQDLVLGLGSAALVDAHFRRLKLTLERPDQVRAWLAHTEYAALDVVKDAVLAIYDREMIAPMLRAFGRVRAPEVAPYMLGLLSTSGYAAPARAWLETHPEHAIAGLLPLVLGGDPLAEPARRFLYQLEYRGHGSRIEAALDALPPLHATAIREVLVGSFAARRGKGNTHTTPEWLQSALSSLDGRDRSRPPAWICALDLPSLAVGNDHLCDATVEAVLIALRISTLPAPHPLIGQLKEHADPGGLEDFAWELFQRWLAEGAPPAEKWALQAIGLLGNDASVLKLAPLIRDWPRVGHHARAVLGLECLRAIGTDAAFLEVKDISAQSTHKGLRAKAHTCVERIAADRGLTIAQLEDRLIPTCDLDDHGSYSFDFGARRFQLVITPDLRFRVRNEANKVLPRLPRPRVRDDAARVAASLTTWKLLKQQVTEVAGAQITRLEHALATGRRWSVAEFEPLLVRHPVVGLLVRRLVWAAYAANGQLLASFRVTEDGGYADSADRAFTLDHIATVGLLHPAQLTERQRHAWIDLLADYAIVPPFPQFDSRCLPQDRSA